MKLDKFPSSLLEKRAPLTIRGENGFIGGGFAIQEAYSKGEYLMQSRDNLYHNSVHQVRRLGEEVAVQLLNRGPHVVDFRFSVEQSLYDRAVHAVADTVTFPCQVRHSYSPFPYIVEDRSLEQCRPKLRRPCPRMTLDERMTFGSYDHSTKSPKRLPLATRLWSTLKEAGKPLPYDGPRSWHKEHSI